MTWNVHGSARPNVLRLGELIRASGADVVLVQEIQQRQAKELVNVLGWPSMRWTWKHAPMVTKPEGMAVLSEYPIAEHRRVVLSRRTIPLSYKRRVAQFANLTLGDGRLLRVANIHLASGESTARPVQMARLVTHLHNVDVIAGDFNDDVGGASVQLLMDERFQRVDSSQPTAWPQLEKGRGRMPSIMLDHVFTRPGVQGVPGRSYLPIEIIEIESLSDHCPVVATITF